MTPTLGRYGIWAHHRGLPPERVRELEQLGFGAIWEGGSPAAALTHAEAMLEATSTIAVATGIVNIWSADPVEVAASYHRLEGSHPGRFLLGIGAGHPEATAEYRTPYQALVDYLDVLDAEGVPVQRRVLAALGPRVLRLAAERSAGAHPYLTTPEATRRERAELGTGAILAPEQRVVVTDDLEQARTIGRPSVARPYLGLVNYTNNLRRLGYGDDDVAAPGSDRLIDDLVTSGTGSVLRDRLEAHLAAGADHVALQLLTGDADSLDAGYRALAEAVFG